MPEVIQELKCFHCGDECAHDFIKSDEKVFCCEGCKLVYEILNENNLCTYYSLNKTPGIKNQPLTGNRFQFLDELSIQQKLISFKNDEQTRITLHIPSMHCSSCIWLLENFKHVDDGVISSQVNFLKKEIYMVFENNKTSLRKIVEGLTHIGYEPSLHLDSIEQKEKKKINHSRIIRLGVAGFCFGNIMMLSFPEYFSSGKIIDAGLKQFFSYLNLILALPVFFYSASEFFINSWKAIRQKTISIDIPIALGIAAIFIRSGYEIISKTGSGFFDSGAGLVFFMLIGRWFQDYTFDSLSFERDYKSYFPIAVTSIRNGIEKTIPVNDLKIKDRIIIRNNEIIPVDATLLKGKADIDYSFVTGESVPVTKFPGELIFAGGKQCGTIIELQVIKEITQSHITQLWNNNETGAKEISRFEKLVKAISRWFIAVTLLIAFAAAAWRWHDDKTKAINAFTAVLVIACPCALALSAPFTYGNIIRLLGKNKIYLRNYHVLEKLADINTIVFDKTGTLTENNSSKLDFIGETLSDEELKYVYSLVRQSSHPLSRILSKELLRKGFLTVKDFAESTGEGISGLVNQNYIKAGSEKYITGQEGSDKNNLTKVYISINNTSRGYFVFKNVYRVGIKELAGKFYKNNFHLAVLSGDNDSEKVTLEKLFLRRAEIRFCQSPVDKFNFIKILQQKKLKVLMMGDGLNDAGALKQSDVGISVADDTNNFTPASDAIIHSSNISKLYNLIALSKSASQIIIYNFLISLLYNFIGLSFAVTGTLSPIVAAILMPISTSSLVLFTVIASSLKARWLSFR